MEEEEALAAKRNLVAFKPAHEAACLPACLPASLLLCDTLCDVYAVRLHGVTEPNASCGGGFWVWCSVALAPFTRLLTPPEQGVMPCARMTHGMGSWVVG